MEIALPDKTEHLLYVDAFINEFENRLKNIFNSKENDLVSMKKLFMQNSIEAKFGFIQSQIKLLKDGLIELFSKLELFQNNIDSLKQNYIWIILRKRTNWICSNFKDNK